MDEAALTLVRDLLATQGRALELYARALCDAPEDVVQEALLRLARERPLPDRPLAWLYRAVRNGALTAARGARRRRRHETAAATPRDWFEPGTVDWLDGRMAAEGLRQLDTAAREVVVARLWGGLSFAEIGELVGCSTSAAQRRYVAGLGELRKRLGVSCPNSTS